MFQLALTYLCLAVACGFLSWKGWKTLRPADASGCSGGCGCVSKAPKGPDIGVISLGTNRLRRQGREEKT